MTQTNLYYDQVKSSKPATKFFTPTYQEKIMAFFGVILVMSIPKLPAMPDYWRKGITFMPWFESMMFCNKFMMIMQFLHLVNNTIALPKDNLNYDKLFKLGGIHITLNKLFGDIYEPTGSLSIDEQMIGIKSRIRFLQYMPKKPNKFGIKV